MKKARSITLTLALVWIILKTTFFLFHQAEMGYNVGIFSNLLFILAVIAITLWFRYRETPMNQSNFLVDFKDAMKHAAIYTLIVCGFIWLYYGVIDTDFLQNRIDTQLAAHNEYLSNPENLKALIEINPQLEGMTKEEILEMEAENKQNFLSPLATATGSLVALLFLSVTYSLFSTLLFRKVLLK